MKFIKIGVNDRVLAYLEELAAQGLYGTTLNAVAEDFVLEGVRRELRGDGFLRNPPREPRGSK